MENKKLNLVELLKGADKKCLVLYSPMFGDVIVTAVDKTFIKCYRVKDEKRKVIVFNQEGKVVHVYFGLENTDVSDECMLFPSRDNRDWNNFSFDEYPGLPQTWDEYWENELKANVAEKKEFPYAEEIKTFQMLLILRDRYNKAATEKMMTYEVSTNKVGTLRVQKIFETKHVLHFVNSTVAEKFLKNFKDMIEQVKDLI